MVIDRPPASRSAQSRSGGHRAASVRVVEAVAAGLACGGLLVVFGACLVASFRPNSLFGPYWTGIPRLRTDSSGAAAFVVAGVGIVVSEGCRLRRRPSAELGDDHRRAGAWTVWAVAVLRGIAILSAIVVVYLSVNAVTHPYTLAIHATHFVSWPTESTLRAVALALASVAVGILRWLSIDRPDRPLVAGDAKQNEGSMGAGRVASAP